MPQMEHAQTAEELEANIKHLVGIKEKQPHHPQARQSQQQPQQSQPEGEMSAFKKFVSLLIVYSLYGMFVCFISCMFLLFFVFYVKAAMIQGNGLEQQNGGHGPHEVSLFLYFLSFSAVCLLFSRSAVCLYTHFVYF